MSLMETIESRRLFSFSISDGAAPALSTINPGRTVAVAITESGKAQIVETAAGNAVKLSSTGTLFVRGTTNRDRISVTQDAEGTVQVFVNKAQQAQLSGSAITSGFAIGDIKRINISGGAGRDLVTVQVASKVKTNLADSTGKDVLTRLGQGFHIIGEPNETPTEPLPVSIINPTAPGNKILWGQPGYTIVTSAPTGVTPLNSLSHITQTLTFEATPDLLARFVLQADGSYRAYAYDYDQNIVEMTVYDYTGILVAPTQPPLLTSAGQ